MAGKLALWKEVINIFLLNVFTVCKPNKDRERETKEFFKIVNLLFLVSQATSIDIQSLYNEYRFCSKRSTTERE